MVKKWINNTFVDPTVSFFTKGPSTQALRIIA